MAIDTEKISVRHLSAVFAAFLLALLLVIRSECATPYLIAKGSIAIGLPTLTAAMLFNAAIVLGGLKRTKIINSLYDVSFIIGFTSGAVAIGSTIWGAFSMAGLIFILTTFFWLIIGFILAFQYALKVKNSKEGNTKNKS